MAYAEGAKYITFGQNGAASSGGGMAIALLTNCAMARLKAGEYDLAKFDCGQALEFDPKNVKALFRRGKAKLALQEFDAAVEDAAAVLEVDPANTEAETLKRQAEVEKKKMKQKEKAMYGKMFG